MSNKEKETSLLAAIELEDFEISNQKKLISTLKKQLANAESELIFHKKRKEDLVEELRRLNLSDPLKVAKTYRELDIESFRERLPEVMKKIGDK